MVDEDRWLQGHVDDDALDEEEDDHENYILDWIDIKDLPYLALALGLLSCFFPWWTGVLFVSDLTSAYWLFVLGSVLFVCGTVLNLRKPIGMIGQIVGMALFLVEIAIQYFKYRGEYGFDIGHPELGMLFAVGSVVLTFFSLVYGAYEDEDNDE
jgi:hypothetical protein